MADDQIPSLDPEGAQRQLAAARAADVVVLAPNTIVPGPVAEMELTVADSAGVSTSVVGWRKATPEELAGGAHYRGAWDGSPLDGYGTPPWWTMRRVDGAGDGVQRQAADFAAYEQRWAEADAARAG